MSQMIKSCILTFIFSSLAFSDSSPDTINVKYYFKPVVKTGTKIVQAQRDLTAAISVIEASHLDQIPATTVMDVVKNHVPGLYLTEWGVLGFGVAGASAGKVSMRGIGGTADTHVLVLRNGRPDCMGLMGCTIADEFLTDGVERIEVLRGPASFLYGSNATTGVINIISHKMKEDGFQTRFSTGYGACNTQKYAIRHSGKTGRTGYSLSVSRRRTDGHRSDADNAYTGNFATAHLDFQLASQTALEVNGSLADLFLFDPGLISAPKSNDWYDIRRWGGDLTLVHTGRFGESDLKIHANYGNHNFADGWFSFDRMLGFMAHHNLNLIPGNTTTLGFDYKEYGGHGENKTTNRQGLPTVPFTEKNSREYAPYLFTQQLLFSRVIVSAGFRLENHSLFGTVSVPKLGIVYHPTERTALRLARSKGFRSPSIRELYFFPSHNENLLPDEIINTEIGVSQTLGSSFKMDAALFHITGDNLITLAKRISGPGYQLTNSGSLENTGYEIAITWLPGTPLELNVSWSHVDMKNTLPNVPARKLNSTLSWRTGRFFMNADWMWIGDWISKDNQLPVPNIVDMSDYALVDLTLSVQITNPLSVHLSLKNALNAEYEAMYGYPMPGRMFFADLRYSVD